MQLINFTSKLKMFIKNTIEVESEGHKKTKDKFKYRIFLKTFKIYQKKKTPEKMDKGYQQIIIVRRNSLTKCSGI